VDETFEEFKNSFGYGSRNNLSFKFLKNMDGKAAADFLEELLEEVGKAYDTGDLDAVIDTVYQVQKAAYAPAEAADNSAVEEVFASLTKPLSESKVALFTSSGHFVHGNDPMPLGEANLTQEEAAARVGEFLRDTPILSTIPGDIDVADLDVRHPGYDIRSAQHDANVSFPVETLRAAVAEGRIGSLTEDHLSFPGATSHLRLRKLLPDWVKRVQDLEADVVLLVPV
jgi:Glycine/sarcosine/betaine reductase selenoprotein B (GRDB)